MATEFLSLSDRVSLEDIPVKNDIVLKCFHTRDILDVMLKTNLELRAYCRRI